MLNVANPVAPPPPDRGALAAPRYVDHPHHEWPAWAGEFLERLGCICPLEGLHVRMALASGHAGEEILRFAREQAIDLIVLAWRGEWEADRAAILKAVARDAPCPTMIVRA